MTGRASATAPSNRLMAQAECFMAWVERKVGLVGWDAVCDCGHWDEEHHDGVCDGCVGYPSYAHPFRRNDVYTREALAEWASVKEVQQ